MSVITALQRRLVVTVLGTGKSDCFGRWSTPSSSCCLCNLRHKYTIGVGRCLSTLRLYRPDCLRPGLYRRGNIRVFHTAQSHIPHHKQDAELHLLFIRDSSDAFEVEVHRPVGHTALIKHSCRRSGITRFQLSRLEKLVAVASPFLTLGRFEDIKIGGRQTRRIVKINRGERINILPHLDRRHSR